MAVTTEEKLRLARQRMVQQLLVRRGIRDERVLRTMSRVERHRFVPVSLLERAYGPYALPIGHGQKTPHPHVVGSMAEALCLRGHERVLEIGSGCGYQTAILASIAREVFSLECVQALHGDASDHLRSSGFENVRLEARANLRWQNAAPFDAIHVSASVPEVPGVLLAQLASHGRLVIPVGRPPHQRLMVLVRDSLQTSGPAWTAEG
jgi:protein-L-isoaspartate(D-aspartate) O-methyltransferase